MSLNELQSCEHLESSPLAVVRTFAKPWARASAYMATDHFHAKSGFYTAHFREQVLVDNFSKLIDAVAAGKGDARSALLDMVDLCAGYRRWMVAATAFYAERLPVYSLAPDLTASMWKERFDQRILQTCTPRDNVFFLEFGRQERLAYSDSEGEKYVDGALVYFFKKDGDGARTVRIAFSASNALGQGNRQPGPVFDFHGRDVGTLGFHAALKESGKNQYLEEVPDVPTQVATDERTFRSMLAEKSVVAEKLVLRAAPILMGALNRMYVIAERPDPILPLDTPDELRQRYSRAWWSDGAIYARANLLERGYPAVFPLHADNEWREVRMSTVGQGSGPFHLCPFCGAEARDENEGAAEA
jgi:hypothetical protein